MGQKGGLVIGAPHLTRSTLMKPKTKLSTLETLYASVPGGEVEIGFNQVSEILGQPTVDVIGPLPSAIQNYT